MSNSNLGRPLTTTKYNSVKEYLDRHIFVIKDSLDEFKKQERAKEKEYRAARSRRLLQQQRLERAYEGLEQFRK